MANVKTALSKCGIRRAMELIWTGNTVNATARKHAVCQSVTCQIQSKMNRMIA